ncbi:MAG: UDP-glucose--hexose-1-phosphate uridylyltransferase [Atopobiaceae bacterium]
MAVDVATEASSLVAYAAERGLIDADDRVWAYNLVLEAVGATGPAPGFPAHAGDLDLEAAYLALAEAAVENGAAEDTSSGRDRAAMRVMGILTPRPSEVIARFRALEGAKGPEAATDYLYRLSCDVGYVRRAAIARNVRWSTLTRWGDLEITINLSKPEKDPRDIAKAGAAKPADDVYPACQLCIENEGYPGRSAAAAGGAHPARQNLRIIPIELEGERWGLQYSPYAYFDEHCIAMSAEHRPMHVDATSISCLLDLVEMLPHYFFGSNADLPIVGGSILSHDHFQGGRHVFPMTVAKESEAFPVPGFADVDAVVLEWPLSVLRLTCADRERLLAAATHVLDVWRGWSDESVGIRASEPDGTRHNTVTPIVRRSGSDYQIDLALRCNVTSEEDPLGVFHPHAQWHHIKRENIGLIEVMGLAILPPRLVGELASVRDHLLAGDLDALEADPLAASHAAWAREVARAHPELDAANADKVLRDEVGAVFGHVLEDAGVYKWDEPGRAALHRFLSAL